MLLVILIAARGRFTARPDPRSRWFALRVGLQFLALAFGYGLLLLAVPGRLAGPVSYPSRLREIASSLVGLGGSIPLRGDHFADVFHTTLLVLGLIPVSAVVVFALRPVQPLAELSPSDEQRYASCCAATVRAIRSATSRCAGGDPAARSVRVISSTVGSLRLRAAQVTSWTSS